MGNARQDRGKRTNVVVAAWLREHGWPHAKPTVGSETGQDVKMVPGNSIEVKARSDFDPRTWWRQAKANAKNGETPCVIVRCNGQGESAGDYLVIRLLSDDLELTHGPHLDCDKFACLECRAQRENDDSGSSAV